MTVKELLQHWQVAYNDKIDIYTSNKNSSSVTLISGIYNEVPYTKMEKYIDCEVISFSFVCDFREPSGIRDPLSSPYKIYGTLSIRINEIGAVRITDN